MRTTTMHLQCARMGFLDLKPARDADLSLYRWRELATSLLPAVDGK